MEYRAYFMRLKKNKVENYVEIHKKEKIWKSVVDGLKKAGYERMLIFQLGQDIILFEEAKNLKKSYKYLDSDKESIKWDKMISKWMEEYPKFNEIKGDIEFREVPVVFYYHNGKLLH
ncbi:MAG: L-rhamnose mutarotase [Actinobacteria bacterium]|nr:L-rhamnose mutarotase [Actinomycetota bacterium]